MVDNTYLLSGGDAITAFDWNVQERSLHGYAVIDGAEITLNTGTLGSGEDALSVASGEVAVSRTTHDIGAQSIDLPSADELPKWVAVGIDDTGSVTVRSGTPEEAQIDGEPTDAERRSVHKPVPPSIDGGDPITALALVWIPGEADSITVDDIFDVRVPAAIFASNVTLADGTDLSAHIDDADAHHAQTHDNADHTETYTVGDYEIQVDGSDGTGIINFHTE